MEGNRRLDEARAWRRVRAGIVRRAVRVGKMLPAAPAVACAALLAALASGCGEAKRDAGERAGSYPIEVVSSSFPHRQAIARDTRFAIVVRNPGAHTVPNVAITLESFDYTSTYAHLAANKRPVWIVNTGPGVVPSPPVETEQIDPPGGGETAYVNTWALGTLAPGASRSFVWRVTPVKSGTHTVRWAVAAGLDGKARARLAGLGGAVTGSFVAQVAPRPPATHVNPQTGQIVPGPNPVPVGPVGAVP